VILQAPAAASEPNFLMWAGGSAILLAVAIVAMRWVGKTVKKDLDPNNSGKMRASMAVQADTVPASLVKEALAKGLVTSQQLATMSPIERQFLFKTLMPKLTGGEATATAPMLSASAPVLPLKQAAPAAPASAAQLRSTQAIVAIPGKPMQLPPLTPEQLAALGPPPGLARAPANPSPLPGAVKAVPFGADPLESEALRVFCPCCGTMLMMPAFPPHVAFCDQCGAKTAVRTEDQGRMIINTAPPGVTRRPVK
jgi:hypothetical protein